MVTLEQFAFQTPLYSELELPKDLKLKGILYEVVRATVDGHCPFCGKSSTFFTTGGTNWNIDPQGPNLGKLKEVQGFGSFRLVCARNGQHALNFWHRFSGDMVEKVGQHPSLADIANDEAATYRSVLSKSDASELHKAIGLAAHGVGIGSFVYLRRLFERVIYGRFAEFKEAEGWDEEDFLKLRMDDKVKFLKGHIPDFLYENRKMYSILSRGIHELSEEVCLRAFEPLKLSIKIVLEEDKKKQEELALKQAAADAIKDFDT